MPVNGPTNRVRIALAINEFGQWAAYGRWDTRDDNAMEEANGNVSRSAEMLGLERSNLYRKMRALGIAPRE